MSSAIAYFRDSTQRQGRSGLGIEAPRAAVTRFAETAGVILLQEFTEVLAREPMRRGVRTARGGQWQVSNVRNLLARLPASPLL